MDLSTTYLGLKLKNPLVVGASPLAREIDSLKSLEDAGAAAVVLHSLFEEQIVHEEEELDHYLTVGSESFAEAQSYFPRLEIFHRGPEEYLEHIRKAKRALSIPVIGSLNGISSGGWMEYARKMEQAGADALELNVYYVAASPHITGAEVEQMYLDDLLAVKGSVKVPVAIKIGPFFSNITNFANRLAEGGADGLVLFNRFYQPDLDLEKLEVTPQVGLSSSTDLRLPLRWVAILYGRIKSDLALSTGVHTATDALKGLLAGAAVVQVVSALLEKGPKHLGTMLKGMTEWLTQKEYASVTEARGVLSQRNCPERAAYERANYMKVLHSWKPLP
jgi:dihydroorotate dehydrogenase (fumarate)